MAQKNNHPLPINPDSFSARADFHPAFEAVAEMSPPPLAASWTAGFFFLAVLPPCLP
jgi:hypothetical protein